jgi:hypothetical protein
VSIIILNRAEMQIAGVCLIQSLCEPNIGHQFLANFLFAMDILVGNAQKFCKSTESEL